MIQTIKRLKTAMLAGAVLWAVGFGLLVPARASEQAPKVIAHRGGKVWAPENTIAGIKKCLDAKVWGMEIDIHRCKSGELVVIHDETLERTTNGKGYVKDKTWNELSGLSAGAWYAPEFRDERLPLLSELLDLIDGKAVLNIEIKNAPVAYPGIEDDLLTLLAGYKHPDKIVISSFDHECLRRIADKTKKYKLGFLGASIPPDLADYAARVGAKCWHPNFGELRADCVEKAHANRLEVNVWTLNAPGDWRKAAEMGVDGIITDDPLALARFLESVRTEPSQPATGASLEAKSD